MTTPRIPPLSDTELEEVDPDTRERVETFRGLNIFRTLAHHPDLMRRWLVFANHVLAKSTLPEREREMVILRVGWRCGSEYEFGQHTVIGKTAGLTDDEITLLATEGLEGWAQDDAVVVAAADELAVDHTIFDDTWEELAARWSTEQIMDLVFAAGQYALVSTALRAFGVQREPGTPGWPS